MPKRPFAVVGGVSVGPNGPILGTTRKAVGLSREPFFFVANVSDQTVSFDADFRAEGQPDLWYPGSGETEILDVVKAREDGYVRLPLTLGPQESVFVTFHCACQTMDMPMKPSRRAVASTGLPLTNAWTVVFDSPFGKRVAEKTFDTLSSWSASDDSEVRYFSGTATYRTTFNLTADEAKRVRKIDLGDVRDIAWVRLNGRDLGVAWCAPFVVATLDAVRAGENVLEVEVTNGWHNRLLGDHLLPDDDCTWGPDRVHQCHLDGTKGACGRGLKRIPDWAWNRDGTRPSSNRTTFTSWDYFTEGETPRRSGLLGPVSLAVESPKKGN